MEVKISKDEFEIVKDYMMSKSSDYEIKKYFLMTDEPSDNPKISYKELKIIYSSKEIRIIEKIIFKDPVDHTYLIQY